MKRNSTFDIRSENSAMAKWICLNYSMELVILLCVSDFSRSFSIGNATLLQLYDYDNYDQFANYTDVISDEFNMIYSYAVSYVLPRIANICPGVMIAENNETQRSTLLISNVEPWSCCRQCSTTPNCHQTHGFNTCCPNAEMSLYWWYDVDSAVCMSTFISSKLRRTPLEYMTVLNCKNGSFWNTNEHNTFDDIVMVHSKGVLYRNKHVAMCNGITEYERWQLKATGCNYPVLKESTPKEELMNTVLSTCIVYSVPPPDFDSSPFVCYDFDRMIIQCNVTGLWETTDEYMLIFLCENSIDSPAFDTDGTIYSNIFCLACNMPSTYLNTPKTCDRSWSHKTPAVGEIYNLTADNDQSKICDDTFVLDIYQNTCRPLLCPSPKKSFEGRCLHVTKNTPEVLQVILRLSPSDWIMSIDRTTITPENHKANNERILSHVGIKDKCKVQGNYMLSYISRNKQKLADFIMYDLRLYSSSTCNESILSLSRKKFNLTIKMFSLEIGQKSIDVTVQITIPFKYNQQGLSVGNVSSYAEECKNCLSETIIPLDCPYVKLLPEELCYSYRITKSGDIRACSTLFTSDGFQDYVVIGDDLIDDVWSTVYYICLHHYNSFLLTSNETDQGGFPQSDSATRILNSALYLCVAFLLLLF